MSAERSGPWWLASNATGGLVVKFKIIDGRPWYIQVCGRPPPGPCPSGQTIRHIAERFVAAERHIIGAARAVRERAA